MVQPTNTYSPDYTVSPGEILEEYLESREMSKADFARRTGLSPKTINQIIKGKAPVSAESAIQFERVLGVSAKLWSNLEARYRLFKAKKEAKERLASDVQWSKQFPLYELGKRKFIKTTKDQIKKVDGLFRFFGVANKEGWNTKYSDMQFACRHSQAYTSDSYALATWMRCGEIEAQNIDCPPYNQNQLKKSLTKIKGLTNEEPDVFEPAMVQLCCEAGVVLAFVKEFSKTHISGMAKWVSPGKALIILSLRHKSDDHLWFAFFHEAAHIFLHSKKMLFVELKGPIHVEN
ncbi:MAG: HigA family addiction module antidote protein [Candidatus Marinimicrobia bacterium]|nr:HigA family addiction module antidote protein [Candidatus Neomarinimicrobiota bacterium]